MARMPAKPKAPAKKKIPPLVESSSAPEIFVSEVVGAGVIGGCISVNLASHRWTVPQAGSAPEFSRVMVGRLILSGDAAIQLTQHLAKLSSKARRPEAGRGPAARPAGNGKPAEKKPKNKK